MNAEKGSPPGKKATNAKWNQKQQFAQNYSNSVAQRSSS